ncbi:hypothetical protein IT408_00010 [Candidatus Uhrbacteria bacterium]|nr:hypothetical protein [Candidatus Uhrbacteria bacterium]
MSQDLLRRLRSLRSAERELSPDPDWVAKTREFLVLKIKQTEPIHESKTVHLQTWKALWQLIPSQFIQWARLPIFASVVAIIGLAGGSLLSVSAAERSIPGDFFYGLKLATEQARLALTSAKDEKLKLKTEFTGRRVEELKQVVDAKQNNHVVEVAEIIKRDLDTMKNQLIEVSKEESATKTADAARLVDKKSGEFMSALQQTKQQLPPETIEKVTEVQSVAADTSVKAIAVLAEKHQQDNVVVSASDITDALESHAKIVSEVTSAQPVTVSLVVEKVASTTTELINPTVQTVDASSSSQITLIAPMPVVDTSVPTTSVMNPTQIPVVSLPDAVNQLRTATTQAFDLQKSKDKQDTAAANESATQTEKQAIPTENSTQSETNTTTEKIIPENGKSTPIEAPPTPTQTPTQNNVIK